MKVIPTRLPDVLVIEPRVFRDERGYFLESWSRERFAIAGLPAEFVQDNLSFSKRHVLRGLHFQNPGAQGKLVSVAEGVIWDVAVDLRTDSGTFRQWVGVELSAESARQVFVPPGFAHGFVVLSDGALVVYKCTAPYQPGAERSVRWDDPDLAIEWPVREPLLSTRDAYAPLLRELPAGQLFSTGPNLGE